MKFKTFIILLAAAAMTVTTALAGDIPAEKMVFKYHMDAMMGQTFNTGSEATFYKKIKAPAELFTIPKDYKEVPLNMQHFQQAFH
jgi:hypothetical protein